jgi:hypothetical protein
MKWTREKDFLKVCCKFRLLSIISINLFVPGFYSFLYSAESLAGFCQRGAFPTIPTNDGLTFISIDLDLPLMPQLQTVDVVLHKATDQISSIEEGQLLSISKGVTFSEGMQQLERY